MVSEHLLSIHVVIRKEVAPLVEDRRMDFDIKKVKIMLNAGKFI